MQFGKGWPAFRPSGAERAGAGGGRGRKGPARPSSVREAKRRAALRLMAKEASAREAGAFGLSGRSDDMLDGDHKNQN